MPPIAIAKGSLAVAWSDFTITRSVGRDCLNVEPFSARCSRLREGDVLRRGGGAALVGGDHAAVPRRVPEVHLLQQEGQDQDSGE